MNNSKNSGDKPNLGRMWRLIRQSVDAWSRDYAPSMGAALAYYTLFSIAPLLIIAMAVAGLVFGEEAARGEIVARMQALIGRESATAVQELLKSANAPAQGIFATVVGIVALVMGITTAFGELQDDLDRIWRVPVPVRQKGMWVLFRTHLLSFALLLGLGLLLLVSLLASTAIAAFGRLAGDTIQYSEAILHLLDFSISFAILSLLFALIFKLMPRARVAWQDVWVGGIVTAFLFELGKLIIAIYLGKAAVASGFGAAGSLVALLVWVYFSAQVFLLGAEFTWVYAHEYGSRSASAEPGAPTAIPIEPGKQ